MKRIYIKKTITVFISTVLCICLVGCGKKADAGEDGNKETADAFVQEISGSRPNYTMELFTDRDMENSYDESECVLITLDDSGAVCDRPGVNISGTTVTVSQEGVYLLTGTMNGQIVVEAQDTDKVQLVLDNVNITCTDSAAVYVKQADKVFLTTATDSVNTLTTVGEFVADGETNVDGTVFSKSDIVLNGTGELQVYSVCGHGVVSKDDLKITGGILEVEAANHAICGKDSIRMADGTVRIKSQKHGLHSDNEEDETKGYIYIAGGNLDIESGEDTINATGNIQIDDGSFCLSAGDDGIHSESFLVVNGGVIDVTQSYEGLEGVNIEINDGDITVWAEDDGLNAAGGEGGDMMPGGGFPQGGGKHDMEMPQDGDFTQGGGKHDMEMPQDGDFTQGGGKPDMEMPQDGDFTQGGDRPDMEMPQDGDFTQGGDRPDMGTPQDGDFAQGGDRPDMGTPQDGDFAQGGGRHDMGTSQDGDFMHGGDFMQGDDKYSLVINGGNIYINAGGDGIDSNGSLTVAGGDIWIDGPENGGNGALDSGTSMTITGGNVVALGDSGMAENFEADSKQGSLMLVTGSQPAGTSILVTDKDGKELLRGESKKTFNNMVISVPALSAGETYTITLGDEKFSVTMDALVCRKVIN